MHTPGPWMVHYDFRPGNEKLCTKVSSARISPKIGTVAFPSGVDGAQELANARLIAAAPDMLAALQWALAQIKDSLDPDHQAALESARACARRATGGA